MTGNSFLALTKSLPDYLLIASVSLFPIRVPGRRDRLFERPSHAEVANGGTILNAVMVITSPLLSEENVETYISVTLDVLDREHTS